MEDKTFKLPLQFGEEIALPDGRFVSTAIIEKDIATYSANGKANDDLIQETAIKILIHVEKFREPSLANKAVEGLPASARKNALLGFFEK